MVQGLVSLTDTSQKSVLNFVEILLVSHFRGVFALSISTT